MAPGGASHASKDAPSPVVPAASPPAAPSTHSPGTKAEAHARSSAVAEDEGMRGGQVPQEHAGAAVVDAQGGVGADTGMH